MLSFPYRFALYFCFLFLKSCLIIYFCRVLGPTTILKSDEVKMSLSNQICTFFISEMCLLSPRFLIPLCSLPSSETVSAHNQGPWWDQLSISGHKRIDLVQHGVAHVCAHTRTHMSWCAAPCVFVQGGPLGNQGRCLYIVSSFVCVFVCSGHALRWELYVCRRECVCASFVCL